MAAFLAAVTMSESSPHEPGRSDAQDDGLIGHELKAILAGADACMDRLQRILVGDGAALRELTQLRRVLAQADHLTTALLEGHRRKAPER